LEYGLPQEFISAFCNGDLRTVKMYFEQGLTLKGSSDGGFGLYQELMVNKNKDLALLLVQNGLDSYFYKNQLPYRIEDDIRMFCDDLGDQLTLENPYPDASFVEILIAMRADLNAVRLCSCETALDIALTQKFQNGEYAHPQALRILQAEGAKQAAELSQEEWLAKNAFADICRQGLLADVKKHAEIFSLEKTERLEACFRYFTTWDFDMLWRGEHSDRDFEGVMAFLLESGLSLSKMEYSFANFFQSYFTSLLVWFKKTRIPLLPVYYWHGEPFPNPPLHDFYFPVFSLPRMAELLLKQGCEINGVYEDTYNANFITALDYMLETQEKVKKELETEIDVEERYAQRKFSSSVKPEDIEYIKSEIALRKKHLFRILDDCKDALTFLLAHGAKTYAELQA
jgi:hypothetical protein